MRSKRSLLLVNFLVVLLLASCGPTVTDSTSAETFVGGECDSEAIRIDMNTTTQQSVVEGGVPTIVQLFLPVGARKRQQPGGWHLSL